jgi:hypothetical protein
MDKRPPIKKPSLPPSDPRQAGGERWATYAAISQRLAHLSSQKPQRSSTLYLIWAFLFLQMTAFLTALIILVSTEQPTQQPAEIPTVEQGHSHGSSS